MAGIGSIGRADGGEDLSTEFVIGAAARTAGDGLPEIALAGRSNVGKSSLINRMTRAQESGAHEFAAGQDADAELLSD